jgi:lipopolysaccharide export LptBFGC system permease protein LptF
LLLLRGEPYVLRPLAATMFAVLHCVSFVMLSSRLLSLGRSAITAQLPALAASRLLIARLYYYFLL